MNDLNNSDSEFVTYLAIALAHNRAGLRFDQFEPEWCVAETPTQLDVDNARIMVKVIEGFPERLL